MGEGGPGRPPAWPGLRPKVAAAPLGAARDTLVRRGYTPALATEHPQEAGGLGEQAGTWWGAGEARTSGAAGGKHGPSDCPSWGHRFSDADPQIQPQPLSAVLLTPSEGPSRLHPHRAPATCLPSTSTPRLGMVSPQGPQGPLTSGHCCEPTCPPPYGGPGPAHGRDTAPGAASLLFRQLRPAESPSPLTPALSSAISSTSDPWWQQRGQGLGEAKAGVGAEEDDKP